MQEFFGKKVPIGEFFITMNRLESSLQWVKNISKRIKVHLQGQRLKVLVEVQVVKAQTEVIHIQDYDHL